MINRIRNFFLNAWQNNRKLLIAAIILLISFSLFLSRCGSSNANDLPGGGAGIFLIASLLVIGAAVRNSRGLFLFSLIFWAIWLYPKVMPILNLWGVIPSFALLLFLGMVWWIIAEKGKMGRFGYRLIFAIILLFSAVGMSGIVNKGIAELKKVDIPKISLPSISSNGAVGKLSNAVGKMADAFASKVDASATRETVSARQAQQVQKTWTLPAGTAVYENPGNGIFQPKPDVKYTEAVKVISLGESAEVNGAIYEKCGLPDPTTGQPGAIVGWIFSGDLKEVSPEPQKNTAPTATNTSAEEKKVIMEVTISGSSAAQSINPLPPGEYEVNFNPVEAATGAIFYVTGLKRKEIKNNLISVKEGEKAFAIWTAIPSKIKISR
ncbi:MAG: hypothetical protein A2271_02005 [Candidatus Moranbacteria bacterium RIFOXYA12_FULL_35_19]|nr:MAG: hypothetical protein UR78_C0029G0003 [Candidatus Moranbacteria bacterium GW2011_GWF2_35_39]OGI33169.1 MAG: hypothetical protein A2489_01480 [Candidatus Moranbacteria bacterium RIFOXYC12_FULL_36_13]OGI36102.1 MAG: hypothetical protein A2271_02005 [Candidatus Moranbacteria bacterium RIFOXYA12_FULL_35_19]